MVRPEKPRLAATPFGTVMALATSTDVPTDLARAIHAAGGEELCPLTPEQLARCIEYEQIGRGLRAEAGGGGIFVLILHSHSETFPNGVRVSRWLTFSQTAVGDAVYWNVALPGHQHTAMSFARLEEADNLLAVMRTLAGTPVKMHDNLIDVPSEADLNEARKM